jgi:hypothetical protein
METVAIFFGAESEGLSQRNAVMSLPLYLTHLALGLASCGSPARKINTTLNLMSGLIKPHHLENVSQRKNQAFLYAMLTEKGKSCPEWFEE